MPCCVCDIVQAPAEVQKSLLSLRSSCHWVALLQKEKGRKKNEWVKDLFGITDCLWRAPNRLQSPWQLSFVDERWAGKGRGLRGRADANGAHGWCMCTSRWRPKPALDEKSVKNAEIGASCVPVRWVPQGWRASKQPPQRRLVNCSLQPTQQVDPGVTEDVADLTPAGPGFRPVFYYTFTKRMFTKLHVKTHSGHKNNTFPFLSKFGRVP